MTAWPIAHLLLRGRQNFQNNWPPQFQPINWSCVSKSTYFCCVRPCGLLELEYDINIAKALLLGKTGAACSSSDTLGIGSERLPAAGICLLAVSGLQKAWGSLQNPGQGRLC